MDLQEPIHADSKDLLRSEPIQSVQRREDELPEGWATCRVRDLLEIKYGKGLKKSNRHGGDIPVYGSNGIVGWHSKPLSKGPTIVLGRKGTVGAVNFSVDACWPIDTTYYIDEFSGLDVTYLVHALSMLGLPELDTSSAIPGLNRDDVYSQEISLAPLPEQKRIVAKVEELLARVNAARERLARVPAILKRFRQSVLAAACSGRLTADWREEHPDLDPGADLVEQIRSKRRTRWLSRVQESGRDPQSAKYPPVTAANAEFPMETPDNWAIASMDELTCLITSGSRDWKRFYCDDGPGTFIMAQNIRPLRFDFSFRLAVNPPEDDRDRARSQVQADDILVTIVGANTGDVCRVAESLDQHYVCQSVALMRPVLKSTSRFLELFLNSAKHGQAQYRRWIYGEGRPHLSFDHLRATAVAIPPLLEQQEIVRRVESLFQLADAIEKRTAATRQRVEKLTQAILAKAFRGELVPTEAELARQEGRDYEPASALLERIRAERSSKATNSPRSNRKRRNNESASSS